MKLKRTTNRKQNRQFLGIMWYGEDLDMMLHFNKDKRQWEPLKDMKSEFNYSNIEYCNSMRAFRRKLKNMPLGHEFMLIHNFYTPFDIIGKGGMVFKLSKSALSKKEIREFRRLLKTNK